jgi:hypothetical protein
MKHLKATRLGLVLALATLILLVSLGFAVAEGDLASAIRAITEDRSAQEQPQEPAQAGDYDLSWWTIDGGGTTSGGSGGYSLGGTAGQPDAAVWSGDDYTLAGGFWGGAVIEYRIYLPLVVRNESTR